MINNLLEILETAITFDRTLLFLTAMTGLFFLKNSGRVKNMALFSAIGLMAVVLMGTLGVLPQIFGENSVYRGFVIVQMGVLSVAVMTKFISEIKDTKQKPVIILVAVLILAASGSFIFKEEYVYKASNKDNVYDLAVEIADVVTKDKEAPYIAISNLQGVFIRQYNANIRLVGMNIDMSKWYEDDIVEGDNAVKNEIIHLIQENNPDMERLLADAKELDCDYVVCLDSQIGEFDYKSAGYVCEKIVGDFYILENQR